MRPLSRGFVWICLVALTFGMEFWSLIAIYVHTGAYPEHTAFRLFKVGFPLGIHRYDLLFVPLIWPALLLLMLPNSILWARAELQERINYLVRLAGAALFGIATSIVLGSSGFGTFEVFFCTGILGVVGSLFGIFEGCGEQYSDRLEFTMGDFGLTVSFLVALLCGTVAGVLALFAYGTPYFFFSQGIYGARELVRISRHQSG